LFLDTIDYFKPDLIVLAGFLWKIPLYLIKAYPQKIINIHPALLPKYGGKGMYGHFVHEAVLSNKEKESGISIHFVNEAYDEGTILLQKSIGINENDTAQSIADKVLTLEHQWYPKVIESLLEN
jgi:phosphoribosylglycinamide formyltransferase-1